MSPKRKPASKTRSAGEFENAEAAANFIHSKTDLRPKIALVLGSGLGTFADEFTSATKIPYADIPNFPRSTAIGHAGQLVIGNVGDIPVVGMQGRVHLYEGYSAKEVLSDPRVHADGRQNRNSHQRRRRHQTRIRARATRRDQRPHQSA